MKRQLINFFKIIRWKNVVIYAILQILLYFFFFKRHFVFSDAWFFLTLAMIFFGISGNIQNNIYDYELDRNKNDFIPFNKTAYTIILIILLIFALIFSFTSFYLTFRPTLLYSVLLIPVLLSAYNYFLKKYPLVGNLTIAFLTAFAIFIPVNYAIPPENITVEKQKLFYFLLYMAFIINLIREITKDLEDRHLDKVFGYKTLPVIHTGFSKILITLLSFVFLGLILIYRDILGEKTFILLLVSSLLSIIFTLISIYKKHYKTATKILKFYMLLGYIILIFSVL
jgi:4-hydroxybenzoate polyprenyltransferase